MGIRDKKIFKHFSKVFQELDDYNHELTQTKIAKLMEVNPKTFSTWIIGDENANNLIDINKLGKLYRNSKSSVNPAVNKLADEVLLIIAGELNKEANFNSIDELIAALNKIKDNPLPKSLYYLDYFPSSNSVVFWTPADSSLVNFVQSVLASKWPTEINLIAHETSVTSIIQCIENMLYSNQGNYSDPLTISIFTRDHPITEMVGFSSERQFFAFLRQKHFRPMSHIGHELMLEENIKLSYEQPCWSLPRSASARIVTRLIREMQDDLPLEILNFLTNKVAILETSQKKGIAPNAFQQVYQSIPNEIETHFDYEFAKKISNKLLLYTLSN